MSKSKYQSPFLILPQGKLARLFTVLTAYPLWTWMCLLSQQEFPSSIEVIQFSIQPLELSLYRAMCVFRPTVGHSRCHFPAMIPKFFTTLLIFGEEGVPRRHTGLIVAQIGLAPSPLFTDGCKMVSACVRRARVVPRHLT